MSTSREYLRYLGTQSDSALARRFEVTTNIIASERMKRGIPSYRPITYITWTKRRLSLLGLASDAELAQRWGCSMACVRAHRLSQGIPAYRTGALPGQKIPKQALEVMGKWSDRRIARTFGIEPLYIRARRRLLGIPPVIPQLRVLWNRERLRDLARLSLADFCARHAISYRTAILKRQALDIPGRRPPQVAVVWTKHMIAQLGTASDERIAKLLGLGYGTVRTKRRREGIQLRPKTHR